MDVAFSIPYDVTRLLDRVAGVWAAHPGLGRPPSPVALGDDPLETVRAVLDDPYGDHDPLVRVVVADDGRRLLLAAHHGAVDGLGLVALLGLLLGRARSSARCAASGTGHRIGGFRQVITESPGRGPAPAADPAGRVSLRRRAVSPAPGDVTARRDIATTSATHGPHHRRHGGGGRRLERPARRADRAPGRAVGASRRDGGTASPDRDTAYLRLRLPHSPDHDAVSHALESTDPEPTFPARPPGRLRDPRDPRTAVPPRARASWCPTSACCASRPDRGADRLLPDGSRSTSARRRSCLHADVHDRDGTDAEGRLRRGGRRRALYGGRRPPGPVARAGTRVPSGRVRQ